MSLIQYLTAIRFEPGAIKGLGEDLAATGITRPLIIADAGVVAAGLADRLRSAAPALAECPLFDGVPTNPTEAAAQAALVLYRTHDCNGLIALGGGSPIDLAKAVALLATHPGSLEEYAAIRGGLTRITAAVAPVIAIPTTAGTGAEVGRAALVTVQSGLKLGIISPHLIPKRAVCDPDLTLGLPAGLTAATGMDAVTHCIETYLSPRYNPPAEAIALDGLRRAVHALPRAVADGSDRDARRDMLMAALEGGLTFQKGLGAVHSLSHALGALKTPSLHHGTLNAVLLPAVLRYNAPVCAEKYATLRQVIGLAEGADLADWVAGFSASLGLPPTLGAMGVDPAIFPSIATAALADHSTATNPREAGEAAFLAMLRESA